MAIEAKIPAEVALWKEWASGEETVLVVFLRHLGCTFCMETISDLSKKQEQFAEEGVKLVLVHMTEETRAEREFQKYGLSNYVQHSDPDRKLYQHFGLKKGTLHQLFGPKVWLRGMEAFFKEGHFIGPLAGNGFQMPGLVYCKDGDCELVYEHEHAGDRPDYLEHCTL